MWQTWYRISVSNAESAVTPPESIAPTETSVTLTVLELSAVVYVPSGAEPVSAFTKMLDPGMDGGPVGSLEPRPKSVT